MSRSLIRLQKEEQCALEIQRCVRAWIARSFVSLLRPLRQLACNLIQKVFRSKRERRIALAYRALIYAAAVKVIYYSSLLHSVSVVMYILQCPCVNFSLFIFYFKLLFFTVTYTFWKKGASYISRLDRYCIL